MQNSAMINNMVDGTNEASSSSSSPKRNVIEKEMDLMDFEPHDGIDFESHESAYTFYQEIAKSMGFTTSIKNSRRSKKTKEFIDAKFACSRYGITPESDSGTSNNRRGSVKKTDCKASMHVKRKKDGKWYIHEFIKEHNHELLPALAYHFRIHKNMKLAEKNSIDIMHAVSERTRKMYVEMSKLKQSGTNIITNEEIELERGRGRKSLALALEEGDAQVILEYFMNIQKENPYFFYAIDLNEDQRLRNLFWIDAKSRKDYLSFNDVIFFDTSSYIKSNEKLPFVPFIGVNHHFQPILLGCGLLADETKQTFVWILKTWLRAMGGQSQSQSQRPKVIITDLDKPQLKAAIEQVLPNSRHCYALWYILERIPEILSNVIKKHENFMRKFNKCIFKSLNDEEFDLRWWKMIGRFELQDNQWIHSLYEDRKKWVPSFMKDVFLAGMSLNQRSESLNSFFDKYIHKKMSLKEFIRQYGSIIQNRYEEEAIADFDTLHKQPALKSPSPWEKQMSTIYTHAIFKKFQIEVLGVVGCHPRKQTEHEGILGNVTFKVDDCEKNDYFMVTWNEKNSEVSCSCLLFELKGFLCRHGMIVLQMCGISSIPVQYILKRWTKDAKNNTNLGFRSENNQTRVQRYNELCKNAIEMSEEGCLSEESYNIAYRTLVEGLKKCVNINNKCSSLAIRNVNSEEEEYTHKIRKKSTYKKRKVLSDPLVEAQDNLQPIENLSSEGMSLNNYYGTQQNVQGLIQLNLMEPPHDAYYVNQQNIQGLGQPSHDGYFGAQSSMPGMGHLDFRPPNFNYVLQDEANMRLHGRRHS